jgi:ribosomal protein S18 acetylase RimI-like enzyme
MEDSRTIAQVWLENDTVAGYIWMEFREITDYHVSMAEITEIAVAEAFHRRGIATQMLTYAEQVARERGVQVLRSETGIENVASQGLHAKLRFYTYHLLYEKLLVDDPTQNSGDPVS